MPPGLALSAALRAITLEVASTAGRCDAVVVGAGPLEGWLSYHLPRRACVCWCRTSECFNRHLFVTTSTGAQLDNAAGFV
jgi:hypothetical protein